MKHALESARQSATLALVAVVADSSTSLTGAERGSNSPGDSIRGPRSNQSRRQACSLTVDGVRGSPRTSFKMRRQINNGVPGQSRA
jgi:hypothetical protein